MGQIQQKLDTKLPCVKEINFVQMEGHANFQEEIIAK